MNISINTDFNGSTGSPENALKAIGEAGFTHLHWCHQWCTDFFYSKYEMAQIKTWMKDFGLKLLDIHGSAGTEKCWFANEEYRRKSGVELAVNRLQMMVELEGSGALMMHPPYYRSMDTPEVRKECAGHIGNMMRTLEELMPYLEKYDQRIALENLPNDTYEALPEYLKAFPAKYIGITYDSGHGNMNICGGLDFIEAHKDRLMALHLHDNDSSGDQHLPPFYGNVDWERMTSIIASSAYDREVSFEIGMRNTPFFEATVQGPQRTECVKKFLTDAYERCAKVTAMVESKRKAK